MDGRNDGDDCHDPLPKMRGAKRNGSAWILSSEAQYPISVKLCKIQVSAMYMNYNNNNQEKEAFNHIPISNNHSNSQVK